MVALDASGEPGQQDQTKCLEICDAARGTEPGQEDAAVRREIRPGKKKRMKLFNQAAAVEAEQQPQATTQDLWFRDGGPRAMLYIGDSTYAVGTQALFVDFYAVAVVWIDGFPADGGRPASSVAPASGTVYPESQRHFRTIGIRPRQGDRVVLIVVTVWHSIGRLCRLMATMPACHRAVVGVTASQCHRVSWQVNGNRQWTRAAVAQHGPTMEMLS